jgi:hypothetical protein
MHQKYVDLNLDFGLTTNDLSSLVGDESWAQEIMQAFHSSSGVINALAFITGAALCADGSFVEKSNFIFDCFDFDGSKKITYDELVILIISATKALAVMTKFGIPPNDQQCEDLAKEAFSEAKFRFPNPRLSTCFCLCHCKYP